MNGHGRSWSPASLALLVLVAACARVGNRAGNRPTEADDVRFSHAAHGKANVPCLACHEDVYDAKTLAGNFLPPEAKCLECHKDKKQQGNCAFCHRDPSSPGTYPKKEPSLRLSHAEHIERVKEDCARCHVKLPEIAAVGSTVPPMSTCTSCHEHQAELDSSRCNGCHVDLRRYPLRPVTMLSHLGNFIRRHGPEARATAESCAQCHDQTFCADCHARTVGLTVEVKFPEQVTADFIHRADFVSRHAIEARADAATCANCHGTSFCASCHAAQNLTTTVTNPRDPHPPGFSFPGPNSHGPAARRDIASCAACHDQGAKSICVDCHRVGGIGGNPHPMGWTNKHPHDDIDRNPMCLSCHL